MFAVKAEGFEPHKTLPATGGSQDLFSPFYPQYVSSQDYVWLVTAPQSFNVLTLQVALAVHILTQRVTRHAPENQEHFNTSGSKTGAPSPSLTGDVKQHSTNRIVSGDIKQHTTNRTVSGDVKQHSTNRNVSGDT